MILSKIKSFFFKHSIKDVPLAVAFSGGTDSTALFHLLREIKPEFNLQLFAIHVNYHLRGIDSNNDQKFVEDLCEKHAVRLFIKDVDISNNSSGLEECARNERYKFFEQIKNENNIKFIATAHTANDQAETLLFRLIRKSGLNGAKGILQFRDDALIRPILNVTRNEIFEYLTTNGFSWREDKSNLDLKFSRNRIRHNIIPELEKINASAMLHLAEFCEIIQKTHIKRNIEFQKDCFLLKKGIDIIQIKDTCFENGLVLNAIHCESIENNRLKTGNVLLLPNNFSMIVLKYALLFKKNFSKSLEIEEISVKEDDKNIVLNDLWEIIISDKMPQKGENAAVVTKNDYPLKIKKLSKSDFLKNDTKFALERMSKIGLSKFERENSPAVFASNGNLLSVAFCSWKFDKNIHGFRWIKIKTRDFT